MLMLVSVHADLIVRHAHNSYFAHGDKTTRERSRVKENAQLMAHPINLKSVMLMLGSHPFNSIMFTRDSVVLWIYVYIGQAASGYL